MKVAHEYRCVLITRHLQAISCGCRASSGPLVRDGAETGFTGLVE